MAEFRSTFRSYGVNFSIVTNDPDILIQATEVATYALLGNLEPLDTEKSEHTLRLETAKGGVHFWVDGADHGVAPISKLWHFFDTCVRILIAEFAVDRVFLHCGVVAWHGRSILFPGDSFSGKTTLVEEFVRRGAIYYSDEYAVLDRDGNVHPFARPLAIRDRQDLSRRFDTPAESLGATSGTVQLPVDHVFIFNYRKFSRFRSQKLTPGEAVLRTIPFAITMQSNPKFALFVLNKIAERGKFFLGQRGNFANAVDNFIEIVDNI